MPRPIKYRRVCSMPTINEFGPIDSNKQETIVLNLDEYETIRLIDFEKFTQEECALQMNIARTTVQAIYDRARYKIAKSLIEGKMIKIDGGMYELCSHNKKPCRQRGCNFYK